MFRGVSLAYSRLIRFQATSFQPGNVLCHLKPKPSLTVANGIQKTFHTSPSRHVNPVVAIILRQASRVVSVFSGKAFRSWWKNLSKESKDYYKKKYFLNPTFWAVPIGVLVIGGGAYYVSHLQTAPITGRKRFIAFNKEQMDELSDLQVQSQLEEAKEKLLDSKDIRYINVEKVIDRLIKSNQDVEQVQSQKWSLHVIDEDVENAFVLPNGHIFVYTGLLKVTKNDDQLAVILGHEMAHAVLSHGAEKVSFSGITNVITVIGLALIWALIPGKSLPKMAESIQDKLLNIMLELPYSRNSELEADKVGLLFTSKACYDVRESSVLWRNFATLAVIKSEKETPEFLSTHPSHGNRAEEMDKMLPDAIRQRKECKCPDLKGTLDRVDLDFLKSLVKDVKAHPEQRAASASLVK